MLYNVIIIDDGRTVRYTNAYLGEKNVVPKEQEVLLEKFLAYDKNLYEIYQADGIIKKICQYVFDNVEGDIRNEYIAEFVHVRYDYVGKLFKNKVGYNLGKFILKVKMEHAKYLIKTGKFKNYEIAEKLGYSNPDYFCKLFKNYTGVTPTQFRR